MQTIPPPGDDLRAAASAGAADLGSVDRDVTRDVTAQNIEDLSSPAQIDARRASHLLERAHQLAERGDTGAALLSCRQALALAPESAQAHRVLGEMLWLEGDANAAQRAFEAATAHGDQDAADAWIHLERGESASPESILHGEGESSNGFNIDARLPPSAPLIAGAGQLISVSAPAMAEPAVAEPIVVEPVAAEPIGEAVVWQVAGGPLVIGEADTISEEARRSLERHVALESEAERLDAARAASHPTRSSAAVPAKVIDTRGHAGLAAPLPVMVPPPMVGGVSGAPGNVRERSVLSQRALPLIALAFVTSFALAYFLSNSRVNRQETSAVALVDRPVVVRDSAGTQETRVIEAPRPSIEPARPAAATAPVEGASEFSISNRRSAPSAESPAGAPGTQANVATSGPASNAARPATGAGTTASPGTPGRSTAVAGAPARNADSANEPVRRTANAATRPAPARSTGFDAPPLPPAAVPPPAPANAPASAPRSEQGGSGSNIILPQPRIDRPQPADAPVRALPPGSGPLNPGGAPERGYIRVGESRVGTGVLPQRPANQAREDERAANEAARGGQTDAAINRLSSSLATDSSDGFRLQQRASLFLERGDTERAIGDFQAAISAYQDQINRGENVAQARAGLRAARSGLSLAQARARSAP